MGAGCSSDNISAVHSNPEIPVHTRVNENVEENLDAGRMQSRSEADVAVSVEKMEDERSSIQVSDQESDHDDVKENTSDKENSTSDEDVVDAEADKGSESHGDEPDDDGGAESQGDGADEGSGNVDVDCGDSTAHALNNQQIMSPSEIIDGAVKGHLDIDYPNLSKVIRIFTSSTFTDTRVERNTLMEKIYPRLKTYCQERGYDFQVVDMRWGVRDEATDDHLTSELCMRELSDCQKLSTGPNFITFLGQKYGYRPFPPKIVASEFDKLLSATDNPDEKNLLSHWFARDDNCVTPQFLLQPIRSKLPHYADDAHPDKRKQDRDKWWADFERMQVILRRAADKASLPPDERHKYFMSVTEEEITHGILRAADTKLHCYWFKRVITDLDKHVKSKNARRFMDIGTDVDQEAITLLNKLKDKKVAAKLPSENVKTYEVKWTENGIDPSGSDEHKRYIESFCSDFDTTLRQMIHA